MLTSYKKLGLSLALVLSQAASAQVWQGAMVDQHTTILHWGGGEQMPASLMQAESKPQSYALAPLSALQSEWLTIKPVADSSCVELHDKRKSQQALSSLCVKKHANGRWTLSMDEGQVSAAFGLGQQHDYDGYAEGNWLGEWRVAGGREGNKMVYQGDGAVGNTQIPLLYLLGPEKQNLAIFFDHSRPLSFKFDKQPYQVQGEGEHIRLFVFAGKDLVALRQAYLELTGRPPVPPRAMFGLWLSEYGFDNWAELDDKLATLQQHGFPLSGVVMDLQWFGGIQADSARTAMGSLTWDRQAFPEPEQKIADYAERGIAMMVIEEPYVGGAIREHSRLDLEGGLVLACPPPCLPARLEDNPWWGKGGMIDYSNQQAAAFWHDFRREALIEDGIIAHWTDLGEPEAYARKSWYHGVEIDGELKHDHRSVHNLYNLLWSKSIFEGYARNQHQQRPFIMSRSGTAGSQRYGVAMWSGDIGPHLYNLRGHFKAQSHMSLSGIDYFGSDVGGFHGKPWDDQYTQWFAAAAFTDVPLRPHTFNLDNDKETAPDRIGHRASNLANLKLRYALEPYYYTQAHLAWREGLAVVAPVVYRYQQEAATRVDGRTKLIGDALLVGLEAKNKAKSTTVYLPKGQWWDYHAKQIVTSSGQQVKRALYHGGLYRLPLFVKAGSIVPQQGEQGVSLLAVWDGEQAHGRLIQDDGKSIAYQQGELLDFGFLLSAQAQQLQLRIVQSAAGYPQQPEQQRASLRLFNLAEKVSAVRNAKGEALDWTQQAGQLQVEFLLASKAGEQQVIIELADQ